MLQIAKTLADGLQVNRNKLLLVNLNPPSAQDVEEVSRLLEKAAASARGISIDKQEQAVEAAFAVSRLESQLLDQIKVMEE